jgi:hypothetical protein
MSAYIRPAYVFSMDAVTNEAAAYNYLSLFNPLGSGKALIVSGIFISSTLLTSSSITASLRGWRTTAASGGTLQPDSVVGKAQSHFPDPVAQVRTGNPTTTRTAALFNSPSPIQDKAAPVHDVGVGSLVSPFTLVPDEGIVLRSEAGIGTGATWNISIVWAEAS